MIIVNNEIIKGKQEFKNGNYEKALGHFENVGEDNEFYGYAQLFCANCLMELKRYDDALKIVNVLILQNPYNKLAWFNKVLCYIFSDDEKNALNIMDDVISVVDMGDKYDLVFLAKLYKLLHCYDDALRYCNMALEIDGEFREALYEKSFIAMRNDDSKALDEISEKFLGLSDSDLFSLMPAFLLKLFSKDYAACVDLIEKSDLNEFDEEHVGMLKGIVYNQICREYSVALLVVNEENLSIDDALGALIDFVEMGKTDGEIAGVQYFIL